METHAVAKPDAKANASKPAVEFDTDKPDAKADGGKPAAAPASGPEPKRVAKPDQNSDASPEVEARSRGAKNPGVSVLDKTLGELLLAGMAKDPQDAGRLIAAAIAPTPTAIPVAEAPEPRPEAGSDAKIATPSA